MKFDRKDKIEIFENAISWIVVFGLFVYGGGKALQFEGANAIEKTVSEMTGMQLMWAFDRTDILAQTLVQNWNLCPQQ